MKRGLRATVFVLTGVLISTGAKAVTPDASGNKYQGIVDRNVFNVHPAVPHDDAADRAAREKQQIPKLTLNGITTILGKKMTFITVPATKPGTQPETLMLAEGQAQDDIEVRQIDEKAGVVKVVNHSDEQTLDFEHDGTKPAGPPANPATPVTIPPMPAAPVLPIPQPQPGVNVIRPIRTLPSRSSPFSSGLGGNMSPNANPAQTPLTQEQITTLIEAQRMKYISEGDPTAKILPPTERTQEMLDGMSGGGATPGQAAQ
jgi:hypothetical protein